MLNEMIVRNFADRLKRSNSSIVQLSAFAASLLILTSACGEASPDEAREHYSSPVERVDFDFGGRDYEDTQDFSIDTTFGGDCLEHSPYDPISDDVPAILETEMHDGAILVATLTPSRTYYPGAHPLRLTGFEDTSGPLLAADAPSLRILEDYGCVAE